jgi:hypothetical protein
MRTRLGLATHLAALIAAGLVAWFVFQPDAGTPAGEQVLLDADPADVERLHYRTDQREVVAEALAGGGFELVLREKRSPRAAGDRQQKAEKDTGEGAGEGADEGAADPADEGAAEEAGAAVDDDAGEDAGEDAEVLEQTRYRASPDFERALGRVLPLVSLRDLGRVDAERLAAFGLDEPAGELRLVARGQTAHLLIGDRTYGRASVYVRSGPQGPVHLVSSSLLSTVDFRPPRFKELRFLGLKSGQVHQVEIDCGDLGSRRIDHHNRAAPGKDQWVAQDDPDADEELLHNWMSNLLRLSLVEYLDEPVQPVADAHCRLVFHGDETDPLTAELTWSESAAGKRQVFGRSDFSRHWVRLDPGAASTLIADLPSVLGVAPAQPDAAGGTGAKTAPDATPADAK